MAASKGEEKFIRAVEMLSLSSGSPEDRSRDLKKRGIPGSVVHRLLGKEEDGYEEERPRVPLWKRWRERYNHFSSVQRWWLLAVTGTFLLTSVFAMDRLASFAFAVALLMLASFSTIYKRQLGLPLGGPELVTFGTVTVGIAFGPWMGLLFGLVSATVSETLSANLGPLTWIYIVTMGIIGALVHNFAGTSILIIGITSTLLTLFINNLIYLFIGDAEVKALTLFYLVANTAFNMLVFGTFGPFVLALLTL